MNEFCCIAYSQPICDLIYMGHNKLGYGMSEAGLDQKCHWRNGHPFFCE